MSGCGCKQRQEHLNDLRPGLGDAVKVLIRVGVVVGVVTVAFLHGRRN